MIAVAHPLDVDVGQQHGPSNERLSSRRCARALSALTGFVVAGIAAVAISRHHVVVTDCVGKFASFPLSFLRLYPVPRANPMMAGFVPARRRPFPADAGPHQKGGEWKSRDSSHEEWPRAGHNSGRDAPRTDQNFQKGGEWKGKGTEFKGYNRGREEWPGAGHNSGRYASRTDQNFRKGGEWKEKGTKFKEFGILKQQKNNQGHEELPSAGHNAGRFAPRTDQNFRQGGEWKEKGTKFKEFAILKQQKNNQGHEELPSAGHNAGGVAPRTDQNFEYGEIVVLNRRYGYIKPDLASDNGHDLWFHATARDFQSLQAGDRVSYELDKDKYGEDVACNVQFADSSTLQTNVPTHSGTMTQHRGEFGFIRQDNGDPDMFVSPADCDAFDGELPRAGERVVFSVLTEDTGRPKAVNVQPGSASSELDRSTMPANMPTHSGIVMKEDDAGGFIRKDGGGTWLRFRLGRDCEAFDGKIPTEGARVIFGVTKDKRTGRPKAVNVRPESAFPGLVQSTLQTNLPMQSGTVLKDVGEFGFIQQDKGGTWLGVASRDCVAFGRKLPRKDTRVVFNVVNDEKTGRPKAVNVQSESASTELDKSGLPTISPTHSGTMNKHNGKFAFIRQDSGEPDMFVAPRDCTSFNGKLPSEGTRVVFSVGRDEKTGQPKAMKVQPDESAHESAHTGLDTSTLPTNMPTHLGTMIKVLGEYGFIQPDKGITSDVFVALRDCVNGMLPSEGARVAFRIVPDEKKGKLKAVSLQPERTQSGTMSDVGDEFGFIRQENGGSDLFVVPRDCVGFDGRLPRAGVRVMFSVVADLKTGRPKAANVRPDSASTESDKSGLPTISPTHSGTMMKHNGEFGFIRQGSGEPDIFVVPRDCDGFDDELPSDGARVVFNVFTEEKTGRPKAVNVQPERADGKKERGTLTGTMMKDNDTYGLIRQDGESGSAWLPVVPRDCFHGGLPRVGVRVEFSIATDEETGRLRAVNVEPSL